MRVSSWALLCGAAVCYGIYESAFASGAPWPLDLARPLPALLVMLVMLNRPNGAYVAAALAGSAVDLLTAGPGSLAAVRWLLAVTAVDALSETVLTNRSLFSAVVLVTVCRGVDVAAASVVSLVGEFILKRSGMSLGIGAWLGAYVFDLVFTCLLFLAFTVFTRRFLVTVSVGRPTVYEP